MERSTFFVANQSLWNIDCKICDPFNILNCPYQLSDLVFVAVKNNTFSVYRLTMIFSTNPYLPTPISVSCFLCVCVPSHLHESCCVLPQCVRPHTVDFKKCVHKHNERHESDIYILIHCLLTLRKAKSGQVLWNMWARISCSHLNFMDYRQTLERWLYKHN